MGAWGPKIWEDDLAWDVRAEYERERAEGASPTEATGAMVATFQAELDDEDHKDTFWVALALVQADQDELIDLVRLRAIEGLDSGRMTAMWTDSPLLSERQRHLARVRTLLSGRVSRKGSMMRAWRDEGWRPAKGSESKGTVEGPKSQSTSVLPRVGDLFSYTSESGREYLFWVRQVFNSGGWCMRFEVLDLDPAEATPDRIRASSPMRDPNDRLDEGAGLTTLANLPTSNPARWTFIGTVDVPPTRRRPVGYLTPVDDLDERLSRLLERPHD